MIVIDMERLRFQKKRTTDMKRVRMKTHLLTSPSGSMWAITYPVVPLLGFLFLEMMIPSSSDWLRIL